MCRGDVQYGLYGLHEAVFKSAQRVSVPNNLGCVRVLACVHVLL